MSARGVNVDLHTISPGPATLDPHPDHRLIVHDGAPLEASCGQHRFHYTRGDVDLLPAGMPCVWEPAGASTSLILELSPSLLHRAAADMGLDPDRAGLEPRHQFRDPQIEHIAWALDAERRAGYPGRRLYCESLGLGLAVHLLGRYAAPARLPRTLQSATAAPDGVHRGTPGSRPVPDAAGWRHRGQPITPQDPVQALDRPSGARLCRSASGRACQDLASAG